MVINDLFTVHLPPNNGTTHRHPMGKRWLSILSLQGGNIVELDIRDAAKSTTVGNHGYAYPQGSAALSPRRFSFSDDGNKVLLNTNTNGLALRYPRRLLGIQPAN